MDKNAIALIIIFLVIGILVGYFLLPIIVHSLTTSGGNVFGSSSGASPPPMP
jgi:hypothetical protein